MENSSLWPVTIRLRWSTAEARTTQPHSKEEVSHYKEMQLVSGGSGSDSKGQKGDSKGQSCALLYFHLSWLWGGGGGGETKFHGQTRV